MNAVEGLSGYGLQSPVSCGFSTYQSTILDTYALDDVNDVVRSGAILFVAAGDDGFQVLDTSNPDQLTHVKTMSTPGPARGIALAKLMLGDPEVETLCAVVVGGGNLGYGFLRIYSLADYTNPIKIASDTISDATADLMPQLGSGYPYRIRIVGNKAYVTTVGIGLQVIDLDDMVASGVAYDGVAIEKTYNMFQLNSGTYNGSEDISVGIRDLKILEKTITVIAGQKVYQ